MYIYTYIHIYIHVSIIDVNNVIYVIYCEGKICVI